MSAGGNLKVNEKKVLTRKLPAGGRSDRVTFSAFKTKLQTYAILKKAQTYFSNNFSEQQRDFASLNLFESWLVWHKCCMSRPVARGGFVTDQVISVSVT